ncbi:SpaH/EbpB family LPXTG-anchored major pilin [Paenarthrobacter ureafaciens]|uniref:SpaH/EbpB family LPXTG-anchored major pilin n=1 Tax=Paenarthrobacter ureafaciens TaxID=37931 RepID=UPI0019178AB3|nr:SpaH/EbpB family LPXTG-anchored major pilin [Paenarthrobacter ureafaciens]QQQ63227.1 SpaH/EbpB family LPXTG-anchored major pilin [Paenarthrobacter ureafaciens]
MKSHFPGRAWRSATALLLGSLLAFSITPTASAAPLVDADQTGSITVHKFEKPTKGGGGNNGGGGHNNGSAGNGGGNGFGTFAAPDTSGFTPLPGVEFTIQQVNILDLSTNAGWEAANNLSHVFDPFNATGSISGAGYTLGTAVSQTTAADGTALFPNLPVGLYLVTETSVPAGVTPAAPFLVTIPTTDPDNQNNWLYDVDVYPKNSVSAAEKTVTDAPDVKLGDQIDFTILGDIPNESVIDGYRIADHLDTKLTYVGTDVTLTNGVPLTPGSDYDVVFDSGTNTVSVIFTEAGRQLLAAYMNAQVQVVVSVLVNAVGEIENEALLYPNAASVSVTPGQLGGPVVTPPVVTKWGAITVEKINENGAALFGASFSVYTSLADAEAGANPVAIDGQTTFAVAADGTLTVSGLRYSDWADGGAVAPGSPDFRTYYLVENTAPAGYELLAEPIPFLVTAATTAVGVDLQVKNIPSNGGFQLPFTGGTGTGLIYTAGVLLLLGAVIGILRSRRSRK